MHARDIVRAAARYLAYGAGIGLGGYAAFAAFTWWRFGHAPRVSAEASDHLLDRISRCTTWWNAIMYT